jgi:hypothetical protein
MINCGVKKYILIGIDIQSSVNVHFNAHAYWKLNATYIFLVNYISVSAYITYHLFCYKATIRCNVKQ